MVKGKAGRQLPGEACAGIGIGIGIGISISIGICCLGLARPSAGARSRGGGSPPASSQPGVMGLWRDREAVPSQASDGGQILHPPPCRACRLPRRPGSRSIISTDFCWEGERQVELLGEGGADPRAARWQGSGGGSPSSPSLHGEPFHQYSHCRPSLGSRFMLG